MPNYLVVYHMDVQASCEVEADSPEEAKAIAEHEDWSYDEEDVYETEVVLDEPFDAKKIVDSGKSI